ncbi:MAG: Crp/Fnr family transcriptional regulator [Chitinophagales bacterium]
MITIQNWLQGLVQVSDEELQVILEISETTGIQANETVLKQGQVSDKIGLLLQGSLRTYFTDQQGLEKTVNFAFEGDPIAVIDSFFNRIPSAVSSVSLEPSLIIWTDYERYTSFVQQFPKYNAVFINAMANWFAQNKARMEYLHQPLAKARYEKMCELHPQISERVPLKYIASYLGITQETLSRIRGKR